MRFSEKENFNWNHNIFLGASLEGSKKNISSHTHTRNMPLAYYGSASSARMVFAPQQILQPNALNLVKHKHRLLLSKISGGILPHNYILNFHRKNVNICVPSKWQRIV